MSEGCETKIRIIHPTENSKEPESSGVARKGCSAVFMFYTRLPVGRAKFSLAGS
jgi:hypothetical protein